MKIFKKDKKLKKQINKLALVKQLKHNEQLISLFPMSKNDSLNFKNYNLNDLILKSLNEMKLYHATDIQGKVLKHALNDCDVLASEKTGSGKTLAYLIPLLELVLKFRFRQFHGTCAIVLVPTKELCVQVCSVFSQLASSTNVRYGFITEDEMIKKDMEMLALGCTVLIATPNALFKHMKKSMARRVAGDVDYFQYHNVRYLVLDEADRLMHPSYTNALNHILESLPSNRQTLVLSATLNLDLDDSLTKINEFSKKALSKHFARINVPCISSSNKVKAPKNATVDNLIEGYIQVKSNERILFLYNLIRKISDKKVMVFFSCSEEVEFYYNFMNMLNINSQTLLMMHSNLSNEMRTSTLIKYSQLKCCFMFCTDVVSRGIDIPQVDLVVQFDIPSDLSSYVHRVGRTARGGSEGTAIVVLRPEECEMVLVHLKKVSVSLIEFEKTELSEIKDFHQLLTKTSQLYKLAGDALIKQMTSYKDSQLTNSMEHINIKDEIVNYCLEVVPNFPKVLRKEFKRDLPKT